ncbi:MAG: HepT-like ribonuclease domain-containing protein [Thermoanaerobaculia bacterium]
MAGLRDKLIHDYFGVNIDIVWQIVRDELPPLAVQVVGVLEDEPRQADL